MPLQTAPSLLSRIRAALTVEEIDRLLTEGWAYQKANAKTIGRWRAAAKKRRKELEG